MTIVRPTAVPVEPVDCAAAMAYWEQLHVGSPHHYSDDVIPLTAVLAVLLLIGTLGVAIALVALHILPTGLSPLRDPVSQYALTRYSAGYRIATLAAAVAGGSAAALVATTLTGTAAMIAVILLVVFAVARLIIGFFPMDAPDAAPTTSGRLHNVLAFAAFGSVTAAAFVVAGAFHDAGLAELSTLSTALGVVMAVGAVGLFLTARVPRLHRWFGAAERVIYVGFIAWFAAIAITMLLG